MGETHPPRSTTTISRAVTAGAALLLALAGCARDSTPGARAESGRGDSAQGSRTSAQVPRACAPSTGSVACAAQAFLATLSDSQRAAVQVDYSVEKAVRWSNLPCGLGCRNGLQLGTLSEAQRRAALAVIGAALSSAGYATFESIRQADTYLGTHANRGSAPGAGGPPGAAPGGPPGGPGGPSGGGPPGGGYSEGIYFIAFLGAPSADARWMLQFGGHHYAMNVAYERGAAVGVTPNFVGVEPQTFTLNGRTYAPMNGRRDAMYAAVQSLSAAQQASAKLPAAFSDVLLGPGQDGKFPAPQGVLVGSLTGAQRALVRAAIDAWVGDAPDSLGAALRSTYGSDSALAATRIAWSGATTPTVQGSYVRVDGPRVWIEFVCQNGVVFPDQIHYHTIWRDRRMDYGASFRSYPTSDDHQGPGAGPPPGSRGP